MAFPWLINGGYYPLTKGDGPPSIAFHKRLAKAYAPLGIERPRNLWQNEAENSVVSPNWFRRARVDVFVDIHVVDFCKVHMETMRKFVFDLCTGHFAGCIKQINSPQSCPHSKWHFQLDRNVKNCCNIGATRFSLHKTTGSRVPIFSRVPVWICPGRCSAESWRTSTTGCRGAAASTRWHIWHVDLMELWCHPYAMKAYKLIE